MTFYEAAKPYINRKLIDANKAATLNDTQRSFALLEDAHVIGQQSTYFHCLVHYKMLRHGIRQHDLKEAFGQAFRLIGAATKTMLGWVPLGNTGGASVSPFKPMPISAENQAILADIKIRMKRA
ncbi:DUF3703 domain-containing protein [Rheinheimera sp. UJ51]|uniref:DUF3703 domain-containing protein n=1 Tax=Rheinheimera sp. UJ51 TaxID=2892446 RepID=UPI001E540D4C|nr:DUF3703 domain-containing protein [Rheinheimera sp. UJ51]MCC5450716.1 DUF3703 domain-containing protein [Rheinheimera sp. UJ51]